MSEKRPIREVLEHLVEIIADHETEPGLFGRVKKGGRWEFMGIERGIRYAGATPAYQTVISRDELGGHSPKEIQEALNAAFTLTREIVRTGQWRARNGEEQESRESVNQRLDEMLESPSGQKIEEVEIRLYEAKSIGVDYGDDKIVLASKTGGMAMAAKIHDRDNLESSRTLHITWDLSAFHGGGERSR